MLGSVITYWERRLTTYAKNVFTPFDAEMSEEQFLLPLVTVIRHGFRVVGMEKP